jgi:hypothetical protein
MGNSTRRLVEFRTVLEVDQNFVPTTQGLGRAYAAKSWNGDAVREFQRAQKLSRDLSPSTNSLNHGSS